MAEPHYSVTVHSEGITHDFLLIGGPIDDAEAHKELFEAIGLAAISWARLEQHLDAVLIHVNKAKFEELYEPQHPIAFSGKVRLLKSWFNNHPELSALEDEMRQLTSSLKKLSPHRNFYLHSILEGWNPTTQMVTFNSIKYEGDDDFRCRREDVPLEAIRSFTRMVNVSNKYLSAISRVLFTPDALARFRKP